MKRPPLIFWLWAAWFVVVYAGYFMSSKDYYAVKVTEFLRLMGLA